jgi:hypothetical protein
MERARQGKTGCSCLGQQKLKAAKPNFYFAASFFMPIAITDLDTKLKKMNSSKNSIHR